MIVPPIVIILAACQQPMSLTISPRAAEVPVSGRLEIAATVRNPNPRAEYQWWADSGRLSPQETTEPWTTYIAPDQPGRDRIRVEVSVDERIIARDEKTIVIVRDVDTLAGVSDAELEPSVSITTIPSYDAIGGPRTSAPIAGRVSAVRPTQHRVVVYAFTERWYVQPLVAASFTPIAADGAWSTWTHTGTRYAAVLVRIGAEASPDYTPPPVLDALPIPGDAIVAVTVVEGER